jgi:hypothetical protein
MSRGVNSKIGDETIAANGYAYVKTEDGWVLKHHIIAEKKFGHIIDTNKFRIYFVDNDRSNLDPANIDIKPKGDEAVEKKRERLKIKIAQLQAELEALEN